MRPRPWPWRWAPALATVLVGPAHAQGASPPALRELFEAVDLQLLPVVLVFGILGVSVIGLLVLMRIRRNIEGDHDALVRENATLKADLARAEALIDAGDERYVIWSGRAEPRSRGRLGAAVPHEHGQFLAFGTWMTAEAATSFERALAALRQEAETFDLTVETRGGAVLEAQGRVSGAHAFVRFVELTGTRSQLAQAGARPRPHLGRVRRHPHPVRADGRARLDARRRRAQWSWPTGPMPTPWRAPTSIRCAATARRCSTGRIARRPSGHHAETIADSPVRTSVWRARIPVTVAGKRRAMDVTEVRTSGGTVGFAIDVSEVEAMRASFDATLAAHVGTLDNLAAAVATFDEHDHLSFRNQAFLALWGLEERDVEDIDHASLLELLRAKGRIPEQANFREWRTRMGAVHRGTEVVEDRWTLPDGRTVRVWSPRRRPRAARPGCSRT